ncbi:MAG TPA: hypothetical protein VF530_08505 [Planctomycetota bacterium]
MTNSIVPSHPGSLSGLCPGSRGRALAWLLAAALALAALPSAQGPRRRVVGELATRAPVFSEFMLRGTLPVPRGLYPRLDGKNPFAIADHDGTPRYAQVEIVSRYPSAADGADVVELIAIVHRDPALAPGTPLSYRVLYSSTLAMNPPLGPSGVPSEVNQLILDPTGIEIAAQDCFGNRYVSRPLQPTPYKVLHRGPIQAEVSYHQDMLPEVEIVGSTLPHLLGVHHYLSWFSDRSQIGLDLRFHNAHDGHDPATKLDDPLDKLYFRSLEISLPADWTLQQDFADPSFGNERVVGGRRIFDLVAPNADGTMHVIRWGGQFHRRLMLSPARSGSMERARAYLDGAGRAFCRRGTNDVGVDYWSWWNPETARYFPQRHLLPLLDHLTPAALENRLASDLGFLVTRLASGRGVGDYPMASDRLGWGHPYGVAYGGMTSGQEIFCFDGILAATLASPDGFRLYSALHRMQTDRQPNALFQLGGEPSSVEEWLVENGDRDYVPFEHFVVPLVFGSRPDPFGVRSAPRFQADYVAANGLVPAYEAQHLGFDPHDHQHFIRYTRAAKVLAWLANDSLAADDLRLQAENFHLTFHPHYNGPFGSVQQSGMLAKQQYVAAYPNQGFPYGRGEAWGLDCVLAAYSTGELAWRERKLPWILQQAELLSTGQAACSGFVQAYVSNKAVNGLYQARQMIEQSITENTLVGLYESVLNQAQPAHAAMALDVLRASLRAFISEMAWFPGESGPWRYTGVGPLDPSLPPWCSRTEMPADAWTVGDRETFQDWSSFAYGYLLTGDSAFLRKAQVQIGAPDFAGLAARLDSAGQANLENLAALMALVQRLQGRL